MNDERRNDTSKQVLLSVLGVAILIVAVVGISFAAFTYSRAGERTNTITTGTVEMRYDEVTNGIDLVNAVPMTESEALSQPVVASGESGTVNSFDFTVNYKSTGAAVATYDVVAVKNNDGSCTSNAYAAAGRIGTASQEASDESVYAGCSYISDNDIRLWLGKSTTGSANYNAVSIPNASGAGTTDSSKWIPIGDNSRTAKTGTPTGDQYMLLHTTDITAATGEGTTDYYRLRMWVDSAYVVDGHARTYSVKINVYAKDKATASAANVNP